MMHPVLATRDLTCHAHLFGTNVCQWLNTNVGVAIACAGGIASILIFIVLTFLTLIRRTRPPPSFTFPPLPPPISQEAPPQLPPLYTAQAPPYPFLGQGPMFQPNQNQNQNQMFGQGGMEFRDGDGSGYNAQVQNQPLTNVSYANQIPVWNRGAYAI